ncbi:CcoQ/FixQ family Cbb3-type cytochrome c oxidase assembly chaperone [Aliidiomarina sedimenti]|uniref:CcoQ/FixQ family Cbb3-type cytochrome c oxidase assembly chaperone n=1 Tax=Aliidiomarina sedimenti TaxID=1933879 RepID=A0ABY0C288_9GAMM|nr:cbb3-type cytochrome c oxidase subunit 3 [Aliidiomarina sedimenti]RUO31774.1 CcoQ/FixQ family Cbb3-type cytochrome c oxidase assembly chaperone [Aliidiomarina sedimenti]
MGGPTFNAYYTLLVFAVIIIVILWAYSSKNKDKFDHDANSIFEEDEKADDKGQNQKRESKSDE